MRRHRIDQTPASLISTAQLRPRLLNALARPDVFPDVIDSKSRVLSVFARTWAPLLRVETSGGRHRCERIRRGDGDPGAAAIAEPANTNGISRWGSRHSSTTVLDAITMSYVVHRASGSASFTGAGAQRDAGGEAGGSRSSEDLGPVDPTRRESPLHPSRDEASRPGSPPLPVRTRRRVRLTSSPRGHGEPASAKWNTSVRLGHKGASGPRRTPPRGP